MIGIELLLLPSTLVASTVTVVLVAEEQDDDEMSSVCLHVLAKQDEAMMVRESHSPPVSESKSELL